MSTVFNFTFVPWFRSVAPYIHMHRGKTFVVAIAGEAIAAGKLPNIAQDLALIQSMGGNIKGCGFVIDLPDLGGRQRLQKNGIPVYSLCEFEGD